MRYTVSTSVMANIGMSIYDKRTDKAENHPVCSFSSVFLELMELLWGAGKSF